MGIAQKCQNCGKETNSDENAEYCPDCGFSYKTGKPQQVTQTDPKHDAKAEAATRAPAKPK